MAEDLQKIQTRESQSICVKSLILFHSTNIYEIDQRFFFSVRIWCIDVNVEFGVLKLQIGLNSSAQISKRWIDLKTIYKFYYEE